MEGIIMSKKYFIIFIFIIFLTLVGVKYHNSSSFAQGCANGVCHQVYDPVDDFYYCLGSADNCCCDEIKPN